MTYFNLYSNILVVKGFTRIIISDLQRNTSILYSLDLYNIINELKENSIENLLSSYDIESQEVFNNYLNILLENEYGFITDNDWDKNFSPFSYEFYDSSQLSNLIIEINDVNTLNIVKNDIEELNINHLVIFSKKDLLEEDFNLINEVFRDSVLESIEIYTPYTININNLFLKRIHKEKTRIFSIVFYNSPNKNFLKMDESIHRFNVEFIEEELSLKSCGKVDLKYFNTNISKVLEAINYNSCLYKKISIDINGEIKNCPSMCESFGNIKNNSLRDTLNNLEFKKYWSINKDKIEVCKDCEFRYICTDCRAFTEQTHDRNGVDYSKPLKCGVIFPLLGTFKSIVFI